MNEIKVIQTQYEDGWVRGEAWLNGEMIATHASSTFKWSEEDMTYHVNKYKENNQGEYKIDFYRIPYKETK